VLESIHYYLSSFETGTSILLSDKTTSKNIEDIVPGDEIYGQGGRNSIVKKVKTVTLDGKDLLPAEVFHIHTDVHGHLLTTNRHQLFWTTEGWKCIDSVYARLRNTYPFGVVCKYNLEKGDFFMDDNQNRYRISQITRDVSTDIQRFMVLSPVQTHPENSGLIPGTGVEETSFIANGIITRGSTHNIDLPRPE